MSLRPVSLFSTFYIFSHSCWSHWVEPLSNHLQLHTLLLLPFIPSFWDVILGVNHNTVACHVLVFCNSDNIFGHNHILYSFISSPRLLIVFSYQYWSFIENSSSKITSTLILAELNPVWLLVIISTCNDFSTASKEIKEFFYQKIRG